MIEKYSAPMSTQLQSLLVLPIWPDFPNVAVIIMSGTPLYVDHNRLLDAAGEQFGLTTTTQARIQRR